MGRYDLLNTQQQEAVFQTEGPVLVLAGAGSGKTRVLTHRTAYLIEEKGVNPYHIMAITFTNKAAAEMRERIDNLVGFGSESIWVSTFHSSCVRILRRYIDRLGYDNRFTIYDADDQKTVMKDVCKRLQIDTKQTKERAQRGPEHPQGGGDGAADLRQRGDPGPQPPQRRGGALLQRRGRHPQGGGGPADHRRPPGGPYRGGGPGLRLHGGQRRPAGVKREQAPPLEPPPPVCGLANAPKALGSGYFATYTPRRK